MSARLRTSTNSFGKLCREMGWHKIVFRGRKEEELSAIDVMLRRMRWGFPGMSRPLTVFRQIAADPRVATYFFPDLSAAESYLLLSFGIEECERPSSEEVELLFGDESEADRLLRDEPGKT